MPRSKTNPKRAAKARRYGRKDAHYRRVLGWWEADRALAPDSHRLVDRPRPAPNRPGARARFGLRPG